jgi:hypothetical protein
MDERKRSAQADNDTTLHPARWRRAEASQSDKGGSKMSKPQAKGDLRDRHDDTT